MNLFNIDVEIERLSEHLIDEETGEINEEVMEQLDQLQMDREKKLENIGCLIKAKMAEAEAHDAEMKTQKKWRDSRLKEVDRLMAYAGLVLNGEKFETTKVKFGWKKSTGVVIPDESLVPDEYCSFETERKPMKAEIKILLKSGEEVPGCFLEERNNLNIK